MMRPAGARWPRAGARMAPARTGCGADGCCVSDRPGQPEAGLCEILAMAGRAACRKKRGVGDVARPVDAQAEKSRPHGEGKKPASCCRSPPSKIVPRPLRELQLRFLYLRAA